MNMMISYQELVRTFPNRLNMFGLFLLFFIELAIAITLGRLTYQKNNHQKDGSTMRINHD